MNLRAVFSDALLDQIHSNDISIGESLNLTENKIDDTHILPLIKALETNTSIKFLDLSKNMLSTKAVCNLFDSLKKNTNIVTLNLSDNLVKFTPALSQKLETLPYVQKLGLTLVELDDVDITTLTASLEKNLALTDVAIDLKDIVAPKQSMQTVQKALAKLERIIKNLSARKSPDIDTSFLFNSITETLEACDFEAFTKKFANLDKITAIKYNKECLPLHRLCKIEKYDSAKYSLGGQKIFEFLLTNDTCNINSTDGKQQSVLHQAVILNLANTVAKLIDKGVNRTAKDSINRTALHYAATHGYMPILQLLIVPNNNFTPETIRDFINLQDNEGMTSLHLAANNGYDLIVNLLMEGGASIYSQNKANLTPLEIPKKDSALFNEMEAFANRAKRCVNAIEEGDEETFFNLLDYRINLNAFNSPNKSLGHLAITGGSLNIVKKLSEMRLSLEAVDTERKTPLHYAAQKGQLDIVSFLLDKTFSVNAKDVHRNAPLHGATLSNQLEIVKLLQQKGANLDATNDEKKSALHYAAIKGFYELALYLVQQNANVNAEDSFGMTPLHYAVQKNDVKFTLLLLSFGANPGLLIPLKQSSEQMVKIGDKCQLILEAFEINQKSILHCIQDGNVNKLEQILKKEVNKDGHRLYNLNYKGKNLKSPLELVYDKKNFEVIKLFTGLGLNINYKVNNKENSLPLHVALRERNIEFAQFLIEQGADVNGKDIDGNTPLHIAAQFLDDASIVTLLVSKNADINIKNKDGKLPADLTKNQQILAFILPVTAQPAEQLINNGNESVIEEMKAQMARMQQALNQLLKRENEHPNKQKDNKDNSGTEPTKGKEEVPPPPLPRPPIDGSVDNTKKDKEPENSDKSKNEPIVPPPPSPPSSSPIVSPKPIKPEKSLAEQLAEKKLKKTPIQVIKQIEEDLNKLASQYANISEDEIKLKMNSYLDSSSTSNGKPTTWTPGVFSANKDTLKKLRSRAVEELRDNYKKEFDNLGEHFIKTLKDLKKEQEDAVKKAEEQLKELAKDASIKNQKTKQLLEGKIATLMSDFQCTHSKLMNLSQEPLDIEEMAKKFHIRTTEEYEFDSQP